jgi:D-alanyl-D-alanine dipeptidase
MRFTLQTRAAAGLLLCITAVACSRATQVPAPALAPEGPLARSEQLIVAITPDWNATTGTLRRFARADAGGPWQSAGAPVPVVVGRTGLAWGDEALAASIGQPVKREGDGKSPAGAFPLDTAFGFAPRAEASWLRMPYAALQPGSECVDDDASAYYNTIIDRSSVPRVDWTSAERMRQIAQYRLGVIVGYNATPPRRGHGSCIFLHIWSGPASTTAGCTALDAGELEALMRWLDRSRSPMIVQLPAAEYERLRTSWQLPPA